MSIVVGLTGQSGSGKTAVSQIFKDEGFYVINCDLVARKAVTPNSEGALVLESRFPQLFSNGELDRKRAAKLLFNDRKLLDEYNSLIFPYITALISEETELAKNNGERYILLDAPTLFEAKADKLCDVIVSCIADEEIRLKRIVKRDKISKLSARERFSSQLNEEFFISHSDFVIVNNGKYSDMCSKAVDTAKKIKERNDGKIKEQKEK